MTSITRLRRRRENGKAFTLLELIVVLLVLGILAAIAVPTFNTVKRNSAERTAQATAEALARNADGIALSGGVSFDAALTTAAEELGGQWSSGWDSATDTATVTIGGYTVECLFTPGSSATPTSVSCGDTGGAGGGDESSSGGGEGDGSGDGEGDGSGGGSSGVNCGDGINMPPYCVGDVGPGGGIIFYVSLTPFTCGINLSNSCNFLEVAPAEWYSGSTLRIDTYDPMAAFGPVGEMYGSDAWRESIGEGYANSMAMAGYGQGYAAELATSAIINGKSDWYLPNKGELQALIAARSDIGGAGLGMYNGYWSSTEWEALPEDGALAYYFDVSLGGGGVGKANEFHVRPIRSW